jgi:hypothetical protein
MLQETATRYTATLFRVVTAAIVNQFSAIEAIEVSTFRHSESHFGALSVKPALLEKGVYSENAPAARIPSMALPPSGYANLIA